MDPREREKLEQKEAEKRALLDRAFHRVIGSQLEKLQSKTSTTTQEEDVYKQRLEHEREKALKKKPKRTLTKEQEELARSTGLSGHVVALMGKDESLEKKKKSKKRKRKKRSHDRDSSSSNSSSSDDSSQDRRRRRKEKKKRKRRREGERKGKRERKEKRSRKESSRDLDRDREKV